MKNRFQSIYDIAELCARRGIRHAVICPGSRSAPLVLAFARHPDITCRVIADERSAGFIALGIAQHSNLPTVLICTSGTAAYGFAPAVAEAFFSHTPLLVLTADRPAEWIGQQDGQTIYQPSVFGKHVKQSIDLPQTYDHADDQWMINRSINEAINMAMQSPEGPVHINLPFREPLYPAADEKTSYSADVRIIEEHAAYHTLTEDQKNDIVGQWPKFRHVLIVAGQHEYAEGRMQALEHLLAQHELPLVSDILSNLHGISTNVSHADLFLTAASADLKESLRPDLLITFGDSIISKNLKLFLRDHPPESHWHIQAAGVVADTFKTVTNIFRVNVNSFLNFLSALPRHNDFEVQKQSNYTQLWQVEERRTLRTLEEPLPLGELDIVRAVMRLLPEGSRLHLANSMSVRYANMIGLSAAQRHVSVYANRGTSGIDGCTSTSVGHAMINGKPNYLITGDMAFFYDRNAFWHQYAVNNLNIVVLNNHGGGIFRMIDGPSSLPESDEYFVTTQSLNAKKLCEEFGLEYIHVDERSDLQQVLELFLSPGEKTKVLELETTSASNMQILQQLKAKIKKSYEL